MADAGAVRRASLAGTGAFASQRFDPPLASGYVANDGTADLVVRLDGVSLTLTGGAVANTGDIVNFGRCQTFEVVSGGAWRMAGEF